MKITRFPWVSLLTAGLALGASGCFATRVARIDTVTSYALVRAEPESAAPPAELAAGEGTLVVEALVVPPAPSAPVLPVRLPSSVAEASLAASPPAPAWDGPMPSYVAQFAGPGWMRRPIFGGSAQRTYGRWMPFRGRAPFTAPRASGAGPSTPHFSSPPSFSGSLSSHFAGGYPGARR